ncbi:MAG: hypothetical protein HYS27_12775 [Deltaproteobacteria bacterium]|nr:hypothetical protein [Deltaproteobacteria bacterium]
MTGQSSEELHREVWNALVHCIVSNRGLWDTVDVAEVKVRMAPAVAALPWKALNLSPLWKYFAEVGTPDQHARETLLFFSSRGGRWGIAIDLPPELEILTASERAVYVDRMRSLGGSSGTFVGRAPVAMLQLQPPAPPPAAAPALTRQKTATTTPRPELPWRRLAVAAARVSAVALVGMLLVNAVRSPPEVDVQRHRRAMGNLCSAVEVHGKALLCTATPAAFEDPAKTALRVEAILVSLDMTVLFLDAQGEALDPLAPPAAAPEAEQPASDAPSP